MNPGWVAALVLGAGGSAHCLGMCGPIALAIPSRRSGRVGRAVDALWLNGGRVFTYTLMGLLFGTFGRGLRLAASQQALSVALGLAILMFLLVPRLRLPMPSKWYAFIGRLRGLLARRLGRTSAAGLFVTGVLNGSLPCGMVYMALALALTRDGAVEGALFMAFFGAGTLPALFALRVAGASLGDRARATFRRLSPAIMAMVAALLLIRGLGLNVPYLSPAIGQPPVGVQACR